MSSPSSAAVPQDETAFRLTALAACAKLSPPAGPVLIILATTTPEKGYQLCQAARYGAWKMGLPESDIAVDSMDRFSVVPSAKEDSGSVKKNAEQKHDKLRATHRYMQESSQADAALRLVWAEHHPGYVYDPSRVFIMEEDGGLKILSPKLHRKVKNRARRRQTRQASWRVFRTRAAKVLPPEIIARADRNGRGNGPGAEIGPFSVAMGAHALVSELVGAAHELDITEPDEIRLKSSSAMICARLSDPVEAPPIAVKRSIHHTVAPRFLQGKIPRPAPNALDTTDFYWSLMGREETFAEMMGPYVQKESPRAKALLATLEQVYARGFARPPVRLLRKTSVPLHDAHGDEAALVRIAPDLVRRHLQKAVSDRPGCPLTRTLDVAPAFGAATTAILEPVGDMNAIERKCALYMAASILVDNLTNPAKRRTLIVKCDPFWGKAVRLFTYLANAGKMKNAVLHPAYESITPPPTRSGAHILHTDLYHAVYANRKRAFDKAEREILVHAQRHRRPYRDIGFLLPRTVTVGRLPDVLPPMVAGYTSASTYIWPCLQGDAYFGQRTAGLGWGIVTGGGTEQGMGEEQGHYLKNHGPFSVCISTPALVYRENTSGHLPESDFGMLVEDIYRRQAIMAWLSDAFWLSWGGIGTIQEAAGVSLCKDLFPGLMGHKEEVFNAAPLPGRGGLFHYEPYFDLILPQEEKEEVLRGDRLALLKTRGVIVNRAHGDGPESFDIVKGRLDGRKRQVRPSNYPCFAV